MIEADRVHGTPSLDSSFTNVSRDQRPAGSRRTALAGLAILPAAGLPIAAAAEPDDPIFAAIERHRRAETARTECFAEATRLEQQGELRGFRAYNEFTDDVQHEYREAFDQFVQTVPATLPGLLAMLAYAHEMVTEDDHHIWSDSYSAETLIETFATAAKALGRHA